MGGGDGGRQVDAFRRRLEAMELDCRDGPGGRSLLVRLTARGGRLPTATGDLAVPQFVFATVGANRIKCMVPRALFFLPLIGIADCDSPGAIEARIRQAWRERQNELGQTRQWLEKLGCDVKHHAEVPVAFVEIGAADRRSELAAVEPGAVMLPSAGPLSELTLERAEDRIFRPEADLDTAVDLEIAAGTRMEELVRLHDRLERQARVRAYAAEPESEPASRHHRILLVGRRLLGDTGLIESLRMRGYRIAAVRGAAEALGAFERRSFDLVLTESELDRFEGIEMVPTLRALPGIEEMPIVVVDTHLRPELRETARQVGAAGYVTHPIDVPLIEEGLARLLDSPGRRRFRRYAQRIGVRAVGASRPEIVQQISRGGMLVVSDRDVAPRTLQRFAITLPDGAGAIRTDGEVVYRLRSDGAGTKPRIGVRFERFPDDDEQRLIAFLRTLDPTS
jgi:two-component system chemotaxis response regulator CheY